MNPIEEEAMRRTTKATAMLDLWAAARRARDAAAPDDEGAGPRDGPPRRPGPGPDRIAPARPAE